MAGCCGGFGFCVQHASVPAKLLRQSNGLTSRALRGSDEGEGGGVCSEAGFAGGSARGFAGGSARDFGGDGEDGRRRKKEEEEEQYEQF